MAGKAYGSSDTPVSLDPFQTIVEVGWGGADIAILRVGSFFGDTYWPTIFHRRTLVRRGELLVTSTPLGASGSPRAIKWVGLHDGLTNPNFPPLQYRAEGYKFDDEEVDTLNGVLQLSEFPDDGGDEGIRLPQSEDLKYKWYTWHVGMAFPSQSDGPRDHSVIINIRKLRKDANRKTEGRPALGLNTVAYEWATYINKGTDTEPVYAVVEVYRGGDFTFRVDVRGNVSYPSGKLIAVRWQKYTNQAVGVVRTVTFNTKFKFVYPPDGIFSVTFGSAGPIFPSQMMNKGAIAFNWT